MWLWTPLLLLQNQSWISSHHKWSDEHLQGEVIEQDDDTVACHPWAGRKLQFSIFTAHTTTCNLRSYVYYSSVSMKGNTNRPSQTNNQLFVAWNWQFISTHPRPYSFRIKWINLWIVWKHGKITKKWTREGRSANCQQHDKVQPYWMSLCWYAVRQTTASLII